MQTIYLLEQTSGVEYHDYQIVDNVVVMEHIPQGINLQLHIRMEGYEEVETNIMLSKNNMTDGVLHMTEGVINSNAKPDTPTTFFVCDTDGKRLKNIKLYIAWEEKNNWYGDYRTDDDGEFEYAIYLSEDQIVNVWIVDPFGNHKDYECQVTLRHLEVGDVVNRDIVILNRNGTCQVTNEVEHYHL